MTQREPQQMPDSYGTGRPPVEHSRAPLIVALLGVLLGTNLLTAGFFLRIGAQRAASEADLAKAQPDTSSSEETPESSSPEELWTAACSGVVTVTAGEKTGTGIILSSNGYILTNAAPLENAESFFVTLNDGRIYSAVFTGTDQATDLAVVKIDTEELSPAAYAKSDTVAVGDSLYLFPGGLKDGGYIEISVADAQERIGGIERRVFRTDCTEGGVLLDSEGRLVAFGTVTGSAIPVSEAISLAGELICYGSLDDPASFGMEVAELDEVQRNYWGLPGGMVINRLTKDGNAEQAGLQVGDVLLSIGGSTVTDTGSYWSAVADHCRESHITVEVYRAGEHLLLEIS